MGGNTVPTTQLGGVIVGKNPATLPSGSLHLASRNMVMREQDKLESRRGLERVFHSLRYDKLFAFGGLLYAHQFDADGGNLFRFNAAFTTTTDMGDLTSPPTRKPQHQAAGGRCFFTCNSNGGPGLEGYTGLKVLDSITTTLRPAGGPIAPGQYIATLSATAGWLVTGFKVAYRYTIGRVTAQGVQIVGPPSGRFYVTGAGGTFTTQVIVRIPPGLDDSHFIQLWRSQQVASTIEPDDDLRLVYERALTAGECAVQATGTIEDVVPDDLRGEFLYTNPNSGEGIQQANNPPPLAEEVVLHKDRLWLGRTTQPWSFSFKLLAVGGAGGIAANDIILISSQSPLLKLQEGIDFVVYTAGSASENIQRTAQNIVAGINFLGLGTGVNENATVWAEYVSGPDDALGEIRVYERKPNASGQFQMMVDQRTGGAAWSMRSAYAPEFLPYLPGAATARTYSLQRVADVVTATISGGNLTNALRVGDSVSLFNPAGTFGATTTTYTVTAIGATTFTYAETGANAGPTGGFVFNITTQNVAKAEQDSFINRIHYSKPFEYEAFPLGDYAEVGASDKGIIAMRVTRETLWVFKEDGLFRITGDDRATFDVERVDATIIAIGTECVHSFAESLVAWTTKGVVVLSESTFDIVSTDIEKLLRDYLAIDATRATSYLSGCFLLVDEAEGLIRLHLKGSARDDDDVVRGSGAAMVYAVGTKTWHHWEYPRNDIDDPVLRPLEHGLVNPADRRVFYVDGFLQVGEGYLWREWMITDSKVFGDDDLSGGAPGRLDIKRIGLWVMQVGRAPMRDKRWDEITVLLGQVLDLTSGVVTPPGAFQYGFGNENDEQGDSQVFFGMGTTRFPLASYLSATPVGPAVRITPPFNFQRGQRLWIRIDNRTIDTEFTLLGFQLAAEVLNASITR